MDLNSTRVTHFEEINVTKLEDQRKLLNQNSSIKITPLSYIIILIIDALKEYPIFNSSIIAEGELMIKNYINIGVAVDTDEGLIVPVIRNADNLKIDELAEQIVTLSEKAKAKKLLQKI